MEIKVEDGIEIPAVGFRNRKVEELRVLDTMEVGQSFEVDVDNVDRIRGAAANMKKKGKTFSVKRTDVDKFRCWRTK